jgi:hypothetical protein
MNKNQIGIGDPACRKSKSKRRSQNPRKKKDKKEERQQPKGMHAPSTNKLGVKWMEIFFVWQKIDQIW